MAVIGVSSNYCIAQIEDPFDQQTLKVKEEKPLPPERPILKEKPKKESPIIEKHSTTTTPEPKPVTKPKVAISNPCNDKLSVEFISLIGNRAEQNFDFTIKFTNLDVNRYIYVSNIHAFDEEGNENWANSSSWESKTDVPIKGVFHFRQKVLPNKVSKLNIITCEIGGCEIEFRDVPILWQ